MNKTSISQESISFKAGDALIDPLVINYGGNKVRLTEVKHSFDLDLDGKKDEINFVGQGSGFLALDKNQDGTINDGNELFGPKSGNGFSELAKYDDDKNGWIDENDAIFDGLRIWSDDELLGLGEVGIGAIYLGAHSSPYSYKNDENESNNKAIISIYFLFSNLFCIKLNYTLIIINS